VGFARLGDHTRARALRDECVAALPFDAGDPVHRFLLDAFVLRIEQTCELRHVDLPLSPPLVEQIATLDRIARYKVDRLRDDSPILSAGRRLPEVDSITAFGNRTTAPDAPLDPELDALRALGSPGARAHAIEAALTDAPLADVAAHRRLAACFTALGELDENVAVPILASAVRRLGSSLDVPPVLAERAITVAARFGYAELVPALLARLLASPSELAPRFPALLRALHRLDADADSATLLAMLDVPSADPPSGAALVLAGARVTFDDPRGRGAFTQAFRCLSGRMLAEPRLALVRDVCTGATHAPLDFALDQLRLLMPHYRDMTDSFGTNSHYCRAVLHFVESLVLAITDLRLATLSPRDDVPELAWPYAL